MKITQSIFLIVFQGYGHAFCSKTSFYLATRPITPNHKPRSTMQCPQRNTQGVRATNRYIAASVRFGLDAMGSDNQSKA